MISRTELRLVNLPQHAGLTSCCFPGSLLFVFLVGLTDLSEVVFLTPAATNWLVPANGGVLSFLEADVERQPTVLDVGATVDVVLPAVDELLVWVKRLMQATCSCARPLMSGLSFLPDDVADRRCQSSGLHWTGFVETCFFSTVLSSTDSLERRLVVRSPLVRLNVAFSVADFPAQQSTLISILRKAQIRLHLSCSKPA